MKGHFHYEVIAGRENRPITFINEVNKAAYVSWSAQYLDDPLSFLTVGNIALGALLATGGFLTRGRLSSSERLVCLAF